MMLSIQNLVNAPVQAWSFSEDKLDLLIFSSYNCCCCDTVICPLLQSLEENVHPNQCAFSMHIWIYLWIYFYLFLHLKQLCSYSAKSKFWWLPHHSPSTLISPYPLTWGKSQVLSAFWKVKKSGGLLDPKGRCVPRGRGCNRKDYARWQYLREGTWNLPTISSIVRWEKEETVLQIAHSSTM